MVFYGSISWWLCGGTYLFNGLAPMVASEASVDIATLESCFGISSAAKSLLVKSVVSSFYCEFHLMP